MYGRLIHGTVGEFLHDAFPILILVFGVLACVAYALPNRSGARGFRIVVGVLLLVSGVATASLAMMASVEGEPFAVQWVLLAVFAVLTAIAIRPVGEPGGVGRSAAPPAYGELVPGPVQPPQPPPAAPGQPWLGGPPAQPSQQAQYPQSHPGWPAATQSGPPSQPGQPAAPTGPTGPSTGPSSGTSSEPTQQLPQQQPLQPPPPPPER